MTIKLSKKLGLALAVVGVAVIGGATTVVVNAAIPSTGDGKIYACYRNNASLLDQKGALRVIDSQATPAQTCSAQETALNWDQTSTGGDTGFVTMTLNEDQMHLTMDSVHSKGVLRTKEVTCDNALNPVEVGCPDIANPNKPVIAVCYDLAFLPKYVDNNELTPPVTIADNQDAIDQLEDWYCGPGYDILYSTGGNVTLRPQVFSFFK